MGSTEQSPDAVQYCDAEQHDDTPDHVLFHAPFFSTQAYLFILYYYYYYLRLKIRAKAGRAVPRSAAHAI
jgi:hypothetical protein